ncbi:VOC family protein [Nocardioides sp. cx-169]|uniref:VOC family protein n=1 Tax=Nocardioides sp. cx-169 TaxID=2899080 RepID=UPI001E447652|nr:VOC family protein [Nocardioides sp. cx-169]MCD4535947.1 VOC family protein [Nocardioides sp. cx-169]
MSDEPPVRVALRVHDVSAAAALYEELGFVQIGTVPDPSGLVLMAILRRGPLQLLVDALEGIPFPETERERLTKAGPRGLGVVIGVEVADVDEMARRCEVAGCVITAGPESAPWGERYVEVEDPYGYSWKFFRVLLDPPDDGLQAASDMWFGTAPGP